MDCQRSFVGAVQLFSDKSQVSLSAGALRIYSFHATLPNLTERSQRSLSINRNTLFACLPESFTTAEENGSGLEKRNF